ncbi:hypothetical protein AB0A63_38595 [Lentzea sp. NPDC042327]
MQWIPCSIGLPNAVVINPPRTPRRASSLERAALRSIEGWAGRIGLSDAS